MLIIGKGHSQGEPRVGFLLPQGTRVQLDAGESDLVLEGVVVTHINIFDS